MIYLATGLAASWSAVFIFLAGRALNFSRLMLNNLAPGTDYWSSARFNRLGFYGFRLSMLGIAVDPARLNDVGRQYRKSAIRNEWITFAWGVGGFLLLIWAVPCLMAT